MRKITASDLMNPEVVTVPDDLSVEELAAFLLDNEISGAPVIDADGRPVGVVSLVDIAAATSEASLDFYGVVPPSESAEDDEDDEDGSADLDDESDGELLVADIMNPLIHSVEEDASVSDIASIMLEKHVHRLLVVRGDEIVGIISTSDLLGLLIDED